MVRVRSRQVTRIKKAADKTRRTEKVKKVVKVRSMVRVKKSAKGEQMVKVKGKRARMAGAAAAAGNRRRLKRVFDRLVQLLDEGEAGAVRQCLMDYSPEERTFLLQQEEKHRTLFQLAIESTDDPSLTRDIIRYGAPIRDVMWRFSESQGGHGANESSRASPFWVALAFRRYRSAQVMLDSLGKDNEVKVAVVNQENTIGMSPLWYAVKKGRDSIVKFLVKQGANVNAYATPEKITCLMLAAEQDNVYICEQLLSNADDTTLEAIDASGCTALHHAVSGRSKDTFELLVQANNNEAMLAAINSRGHNYLVAACSQVNDTFMQHVLQCSPIDAAQLSDTFALIGCFRLLNRGDTSVETQAAVLRDWKLGCEAREMAGLPAPVCPTLTTLGLVELTNSATITAILQDSLRQQRWQMLMRLLRILGPRSEDVLRAAMRIIDLQYHTYTDEGAKAFIIAYALHYHPRIHLNTYLPYDTASKRLSDYFVRGYQPQDGLTPCPQLLTLAIMHIAHSHFFAQIPELQPQQRVAPLPRNRQDRLCIDMLRLIWLAVHSPDLDLASPNSDPSPNLDPTLKETRQTLIRTVRQLAYAEQFVEWRLLLVGINQRSYHPAHDPTQLPCPALTHFLLECGFAPDSCYDGVEPLTLCANRLTPFLLTREMEQRYLTIISDLINHGAHWDTTNHQLMRQAYEMLPFPTQGRHMTLQCLAARAIRRAHLRYQMYLPRLLAEFVAIH